MTPGVGLVGSLFQNKQNFCFSHCTISLVKHFLYHISVNQTSKLDSYQKIQSICYTVSNLEVNMVITWFFVIFRVFGVMFRRYCHLQHLCITRPTAVHQYFLFLIKCLYYYIFFLPRSFKKDVYKRTHFSIQWMFEALSAGQNRQYVDQALIQT